MTSRPARPRGRQAQAARNDDLILQAAREVFLADPAAPMAAVAERAGVGIGALYNRYASKEDLLRTLCRDGQQIYLAEVQGALDSGDDQWEAFTGFLRRIVAANTHGLTTRLAGTFQPTVEQLALAEQMRALGTELFERARAAGHLRPGITWLDVEYLLEFLAHVRLGNAARTAELRQRHLAVIIDGLRNIDPGPLPGDSPTWQEQAERWLTRLPGPGFANHPGGIADMLEDKATRTVIDHLGDLAQVRLYRLSAATDGDASAPIRPSTVDR
jgi:AcrR family transcriptional regulator